MIKICPRCFQPFTFLDVVTYAPGQIATHTVFCPPGWAKVDWRTALKDQRGSQPAYSSMPVQG